jgi:hypothetical protein
MFEASSRMPCLRSSGCFWYQQLLLWLCLCGLASFWRALADVGAVQGEAGRHCCARTCFIVLPFSPWKSGWRALHVVLLVVTSFRW